MILAIKKFFHDKLLIGDVANQSDCAQRIELASAALLLELIKIDGHFDEFEGSCRPIDKSSFLILGDIKKSSRSAAKTRKIEG